MTTRKASTRLCVKDVMTRNPVCVGQTTTAQELAEILEGNDISGVPVLDMREKLIGVVSRSDLMHRCVEGPVGSSRGSFFSALADGMITETGLDPGSLGVVEDFMTAHPVTATVNEPVGAVARRMAEEQVHRVVVIDDENHVIGLVTTLDILRVHPV
jgi:CBS domain-containing protein